jgi:hypothetical protein
MAFWSGRIAGASMLALQAAPLLAELLQVVARPSLDLATPSNLEVPFVSQSPARSRLSDGAYGVSLYQVEGALGTTMKDIPVLDPVGFANSALLVVSAPGLRVASRSFFYLGIRSMPISSRITGAPHLKRFGVQAGCIAAAR